MTIQSMHYDFKQKLNRIDSQRYRGLEVPEIDWKLNEAQEVFVKIIAQPRVASQIGFESNQRTIEDIRVIVIDQKKGGGVAPVVYDTGDSSYLATLPSNYWFYSNSKLYATKGTCSATLKTREVQHDDRAEDSPFDKSSFLWREANIRFNSQGIRIFTGGGDFTPTELCLEYLIQPTVMYNATDWDVAGYELDGVTVVGRQDCILPPSIHREIVDLAVAITAGDLSLPDYMLKGYKISMTDKK